MKSEKLVDMGVRVNLIWFEQLEYNLLWTLKSFNLAVKTLAILRSSPNGGSYFFSFLSMAEIFDQKLRESGMSAVAL